MKEFTLERSLMHVNIVASVLVRQQTLGNAEESTLKKGRKTLTVINVRLNVCFVSVREQEVKDLILVQDLQTTY